MKPARRLRHLLVLLGLLICPAISRGEDQVSSFQVGFFHPLQLHSEDYSVDGLRLDIIYGVNQDLQGVDLGFINNANGNAHVFELGAFNEVNKDFEGWQFGMVNEVKDDFKGFQLGLIANVTRGSCAGVQASVFFNDSGEDFQGLQLGLVNTTGSLKGLQIGLFNFNNDDKYLGFLPFINAAF